MMLVSKNSRMPALGYIRSEECGQDIADKSSDGVHSEDVERVVTAEEVFELGGIVARNASACAKHDSRPRWDESRPGSNAD